MRYSKLAGENKALEMVEHTLSALRRGGTYDHVGYGFHRYSTDVHWRLPHFEKMLYDQALLTIAYTEAFVLTRNPFYENTVNEIIQYVSRDMTSPQGAFYSAEDADSEGEEGRFYLWTEDEIKNILEENEFRIIRQAYNIRGEGNYADEATHLQSGRNLLYMSRPHDELTASLKIPAQELTEHLKTALEKMHHYREVRTHPHKDKKILSDWNGLMIAAMAKAGRRLENPSHIKSAKSAADYLLAEMLDADGQLYHRMIDGERAIRGFLDDYAFLIWGMIELYEASFESSYLRAALLLNEKALSIFGDDASGAFFTGSTNDLPLRKKGAYDGAIPSGNSVAMLNMLRLARLTGRVELEKRANIIGREFAQDINRNPTNHVQMIIAMMQAFQASPEIVITGRSDDPQAQELKNTINRSTLLDVDVLHKPIDRETDISELAPFTVSLQPIGNRATAYLCRNYQCEMPTHEIEELARKLMTNGESHRD
jgi:uncharacterized protein YyaL (SSP411 family)